mmetsp:Transcript_22754/g.38044  ORF Transcript_22754/g.38044 Transcript_22754/m.38044 type:complete len:331 (-) Transcript_22754:392-1384(-)|eukprot:CAMPEP_0198205760 /NCGR_PEP_ID=MMETSP1445-20131203/9285_1 /TAXON_ID=36898 /ORGANISM="Pyramimonas sp., Strain CCMP2087" /LENGTH=330 /DNA_ID=CAMNT_0043878173 /DNA_START=435 /DNA_END=1427 /DNA_ORIENTATION=+
MEVRRLLLFAFCGLLLQVFSLVSCTQIAVIITGQLRLRNAAHLRQLQKVLTGADVFICGPKISPNAHSMINLTKVVAFSLDDPDVSLFPNVSNVNRLIQWARLSQCHSLLEEHVSQQAVQYDVVVKLRTDEMLHTDRLMDFLSRSQIEENTLYCLTDWGFYGKPKTMRVISQMYTESLRTYVSVQTEYVPLDYGSLLQSDLMAANFWWLRFPDEYISLGDLRKAHKESNKFRRLISTCKQSIVRSFAAQSGSRLKKSIRRSFLKLQRAKANSTSVTLAPFAVDPGTPYYSSEKSLALHLNVNGIVAKYSTIFGTLYRDRKQFPLGLPGIG